MARQRGWKQAKGERERRMGGKRASAQESKREKEREGCVRAHEQRVWVTVKPLQVLPFLWHPYQLRTAEPLGPEPLLHKSDGGTQQQWQSVWSPSWGKSVFSDWLKPPASAYLIYQGPSGHLLCPSAERVTARSPTSVFEYYISEEISAYRLGHSIKVHPSSTHKPIYANYSFIRLYNIFEMFQICI